MNLTLCFIRNHLFCIISSVLISFSSFSATFTSSGSGNWNLGTTWGGACGGGCTPGVDYPSTSDNAVISAGHTVTQNITTEVQNVTINATGKLTSNYNLYLRGNYTNDGTHDGSGTILFQGGHGWTISGAGSFSNTGNWDFYVNRTISGAVTRSSGTIIIRDATTLTISGTFTANVAFSMYGSATITNTGTFNINYDRPTGTLNASAIGNTVNYGQIGGTQSLRVPATSYYNLTLGGTSTKLLPAAIDVDNNFTVNSGLANLNNNNLTIGGNWTNNSGANLSNIATVTFDGSGTQTISRSLSQTEVFNHLTIGGTGTVQLSNKILINGNLSISSGTFNVNGSGNYIQLKGNWTKSGGTFTHSNSDITLNGSSGQTIGGASPTTFYHLTLNNSSGASFSSAQNIEGNISMLAGSFTSSIADVTLISNSSLTARIGIVNSGSSLIGSRWIVQRYVSTSAPSTTDPYWGYLASPMTDATLSDWDTRPDGVTNEIWMSGVSGPDGTSCCPTFYSVRKYQGSSTNVTSNIALTNGEGYQVWLADNESSLSAFTFDTDGTPFTGNKTIFTPASGYYLMGNPFAAQIRWSLLSRSNINNFFYMLDESLKNYATWDGGTGTGTGKLSGSSGVINSSQGFLVQATAAGSLTIEDADKVVLTAPFVRQSPPKNIIRINLKDGKNKYGAENLIAFTDHHRIEDLKTTTIPSLRAPDELAPYMRILCSNALEAFKNDLDINEKYHRIPILISSGTKETYTIGFENLHNTDYSCSILEDLQTKETSLITDNSRYQIDIQEINKDYKFILHLQRIDPLNSFCQPKVYSEPFDLAGSIKFYPNELGIVFSFGFLDLTPVKIELYNTLGQKIMEKELYAERGDALLNFEGQKGIYIVKVSAMGQSISRKLKW